MGKCFVKTTVLRNKNMQKRAIPKNKKENPRLKSTSLPPRSSAARSITVLFQDELYSSAFLLPPCTPLPRPCGSSRLPAALCHSVTFSKSCTRNKETGPGRRPLSNSQGLFMHQHSLFHSLCFPHHIFFLSTTPFQSCRAQTGRDLHETRVWWLLNKACSLFV